MTDDGTPRLGKRIYYSSTIFPFSQSSHDLPFKNPPISPSQIHLPKPVPPVTGEKKYP